MQYQIVKSNKKYRMDNVECKRYRGRNIHSKEKVRMAEQGVHVHSAKAQMYSCVHTKCDDDRNISYKYVLEI
jgi:hypothetical protein